MSSESSQFPIDRNPSPPPEILNNENILPDKIGESVYSKKWLLQTLVNIVQYCDTSQNGTHDEVSTEKTNLENDSNTEIVELDSKMEEDACNLWDMSAAKDVADFLVEFGVSNIILSIIEKTKSPRLLEIAIGILGNMCTFDHICRQISENKPLLYAVLHISGTSDTPTLVQVFRTILCGIRDSNCQSLWFEVIDGDPDFFENLNFILYNSLSYDVISGALNVLASLLTHHMQYCVVWGKSEFLKSILMGGKQLLALDQCLDCFFDVLWALTQYIPNAKELVNNWGELNPIFTYKFLTLHGNSLPNKSMIPGIHYSFQIYNDIVRCETMTKELIALDIKTLNALHKFVSLVNTTVMEVMDNNVEMVDFESPSDEAGIFLKRVEEREDAEYIRLINKQEFQALVALGEVISETAQILITLTDKEPEQEIINGIINLEEYVENIAEQ